MITEKLLEFVKRQTLLAAKIEAGTATPDERAELVKINHAISAAVNPQKTDHKTVITTMRVDEFKTHVEAELEALKTAADADRLALLQSNIASVKAQGKTLAEDIVGIQIFTAKSSDDRIAALEATVTDLSDKLQAAETDKAEKPTAHALAMEAIDTLLARMESIKAKIEGGSLTEDDLESMWDGDWEIRQALRQAVAIMTKAEELHKLLSVVVPAWEVLAKDGEGEAGEAEGEGEAGEGNGEGDGEGEAGEAEGEGDGEGEAGEAEGEGDGEGEAGEAEGEGEGDGEAGEAEGVDKSEGWGTDLAPAALNGNEDYSLLKGRSKKDTNSE